MIRVTMSLEYMGIPFELEIDGNELFNMNDLPKIVEQVRKLIDALLKQKKETKE
jgi:hypothetical protein